MKKLSIFLSIFLVYFSVSCEVVTLGWFPSPSTNVAGYKLYQGSASNNYTNYALVSGTSITLNLTRDGVYYFALTSYFSNGVESVYTKELMVTNKITNLPSAVSDFSVVAVTK